MPPASSTWPRPTTKQSWLRTRPTSSRSTTSGSSCQTEGNAVDAEKDYRLALNTNPNFEAALFNLAILRTQSGAVDEAISLYQRVLTLNPNNAGARLNLGLLHLQVGQTAAGNEQRGSGREAGPDARVPGAGFGADHRRAGHHRRPGDDLCRQVRRPRPPRRPRGRRPGRRPPPRADRERHRRPCAAWPADRARRGRPGRRDPGRAARRTCLRSTGPYQTRTSCWPCGTGTARRPGATSWGVTAAPSTVASQRPW